MNKLTIAGMPIHTLFSVPLGALVLAGMSDAAARITGEKSWARTAYHLLLFGATGGIIAGLPGLIDYEAIPENSESKREAYVHAVMNVGLLGASLLGVMARRRDPEHPSWPASIISMAIVPALIYSRFQGTKLVVRSEMELAGNVHKS